jgi:eukaryotic-like serine/threonine-protein kinase
VPLFSIQNEFRYEIVRKIFEGGMGIVYEAEQHGSRDFVKRVAIKIIRPNYASQKMFIENFIGEAKLVADLIHTNIVQTYHLGEANGVCFIAMELIRGVNLEQFSHQLADKRKTLSKELAVFITSRIARGLAYAHSKSDKNGKPMGIVHRDVSFKNILIAFEGDVKLTDFGIAKARGRSHRTQTGHTKGKVAYMSPEQAVGAAIDRRTDVFALGTTLWELACDRRLFKRTDDVETLRRVHAAEVPDPMRLVEGFPPALWRVLHRALAREPAQRYPTAAELAHDLDAVFPRGPRDASDAQSVATVMRELFGEDHARQATWVAEVSGPVASRVSVDPLKARSTFWGGDEAPPAPPAMRPLAPSTPGAAFPSPRPPRLARSRGSRTAVTVGVVLAVVIAALVVAVMAYR